MAKISDSELAALNATGPLLRFAAERVKNLNADLPLAIAQAREAAETDQWSPEISQRFWDAFAKLCDQVQPVTMDTLETAQHMVPPSSFLKLFGSGERSIAQRSSGRYLLLLFVLLGLILPIQLYVWTCTNLSKKIDDLVAGQRTQYSTLAQEYSRLNVETRNIPTDKWSREQQERADRVTDAAAAVQATTDRIIAEAELLKSISTGSALYTSTETAPAAAPAPIGDNKQWFENFQGTTTQMNSTQSRVVGVQEEANLIVGVLGAYILPILFGSIGAVAYIIRTISEQIRGSTFSSSSPTRHIMRTALGAMAGLVVGLFSDLSTKLSLPPLAVAFLAGYGVEALFSMFDNFIAKFK
jgi:hypothetical protein